MLRQGLYCSHADLIRCHRRHGLDTRTSLTWQHPRSCRAKYSSALAAHATAVTDRTSPTANGRPERLERQISPEQSDQTASGSDSTANANKPSASERPQSSLEAIQKGIEELNAGRAQQAIELFQAALQLPGNGFMRFAGTVREYRCPSEGEEQAALYNMACAYAALSQRDSALACLEGAFEAGLLDFAAVRSDPDLRAIRGPELDKLLSEYDNLLAKVFKKRKQDTNKPWLGW